MNDRLKDEIDKIISEMAPPVNSIGMLATDDVARIVRQAATKGAMAGWLAGERIARTHCEKSAQRLNDFLLRLLDPEDLGHAVTPEVRKLTFELVKK